MAATLFPDSSATDFLFNGVRQPISFCFFLFIYFWLRWVFVALHAGFSLWCGAQALGVQASVVVARGL